MDIENVSQNSEPLIDGTLRMRVKPGSKYCNLIPYAVNAFTQSCCHTVVWNSLHGATSKTLSCAEQFKKQIMSSVLANHEVPKLYQTVNIYYQSRTCTDAAAGVRYSLQEPAITITLSKVPCGDACEREVGSTCTFKELTTSTHDSDHVKPPSRRRLEHLKKKKRDPVSHRRQPGEGEPTVDHESSFQQCPRLAPSLEAVARKIGKTKRKRKHKS